MYERLIEKDFCAYAKTKDCLCVKLEVQNDRGWPDRMVICPNGRVIFLEFKNSSGRPSPHQIRKRCQLRERGHVAEIVYTLAAAVKILDAVLNEKDFT